MPSTQFWIFVVSAAALSLVVPAPSTAQEDKWPTGSAMYGGQIAAAELDALAVRLDRLDEQVVEIVVEGENAAPPVMPNARLIGGLRKLQNEWRLRVKAECEVVGALTRAGGTWPSTHALNCEVRAFKARITLMQSTLQCLKSVPTKRRRHDQERCLTPLLSLQDG